MMLSWAENSSLVSEKQQFGGGPSSLTIEPEIYTTTIKMVFSEIPKIEKQFFWGKCVFFLPNEDQKNRIQSE